MSLNIKNNDTEQLVRELSARTGETVTGAITESVRERLARLDENDAALIASRLKQLQQISADAAPRWTLPVGGADHADLLYDDKGLPA